MIKEYIEKRIRDNAKLQKPIIKGERYVFIRSGEEINIRDLDYNYWYEVIPPTEY